MNKRIVSNLYKSLLSYIFKTINGNIILSKKSIKEFVETKEIKNNFFQKKYFLYKIKNGSIFTDNTENVGVFFEKFLYGPASFQQIDHHLKPAKYNSVLKKGTPKFKKKFKGRIFSVVQGGSGENYFHWLFDILPKFKILSFIFKLDKIDYLYLPDLKSFHYETLNLLKIPKKKIINSKLNPFISGEEIILSEQPWWKKNYALDNANVIPKWVIKWLRAKFLRFKKKFNSKKKIFIDRSDSVYRHCQIVNKYQLIKFLKKKNYKIYNLNKMKFVNQIYLFWNATNIISAHGAALSNLAFCKKGTKIIELKPYNHPGKIFKRISKVNGLKHNFLVSKKKYLNNLEGDIFVDIVKLNKML